MGLDVVLVRVVGRGLAYVHAGGRTRERTREDARAFEGLPDHRQQQPVLGIHARRFGRGDLEEPRVEGERVVQEAAVPADRAPGCSRLRRVDGLDVEALSRDGRDTVPVPDKVGPVLLDALSLGKTAPHPHYGDGRSFSAYAHVKAPYGFPVWRRTHKWRRPGSANTGIVVQAWTSGQY